VIMSDLVKAQNTPQFNWYTHWKSLDADGMPDKLIEEGLKQPDRIKVSFEKEAKEITGHVAPNQAWFGMEYFLAYTLPNFKSKILNRLSDTQKDNGPLLFSLLGQCFQDVGLTEWTSVVAKRCPNDADHTKANFNKCIRDYLEAVTRFPNIGDQLICWLRTAKKPALMPMHEFMRRQVQLLSYLKSDYLHWTMDVPTAQEKSEQIFFAQPKVHQNKFANLNKTVPSDPLRMIAFFKQCQATDKAAGVLDKIAKDKKQPKEKRRLMFLPRVAVNWATVSIAVVTTVTIIEATNAIATITDLTTIIERTNATIALDVTTRTWKVPSPMTKRMITSTITPRKRATRPCIMTSPLSRAPVICPEKEVDLVQDLLRALNLGLALAQAVGAMTTIMSTKMIASQAQTPSTGTPTPPRMTTADAFIALTKAILSLPPSLLQRQRKSAPRNRELCQ
jgi:hypothetical protein